MEIDSSLKFACLVLALTVCTSALLINLRVVLDQINWWVFSRPYRVGEWYEMNFQDPWGKGTNLIFKVMDVKEGHTRIQYLGLPDEKHWVVITETRYQIGKGKRRVTRLGSGPMEVVS